MKWILIDQSELSSRAYNCLKRSNIHTLSDFLSKNQKDLMRIEYFRIGDPKVDTLRNLFLKLIYLRISFHLKYIVIISSSFSNRNRK